MTHPFHREAVSNKCHASCTGKGINNRALENREAL